MRIEIPELCLVLLAGPSGAGKSTFARKHFKPTEIISSDVCRALVSDDENNQDATLAAFDLVRFLASKRLGFGRLTVIDATNTRSEARAPYLELARRYHVPAYAVAFDLAEELCVERNCRRSERSVERDVVLQQARRFRDSLPAMRREGFEEVFVLSFPEEAESTVVERLKLPVNRRDDAGPFDIVGDVHGCLEELKELLTKLGYRAGEQLRAPDGRKLVFLGDLVDRGPDIPGVLRLVMSMVEEGAALCVVGNHDDKLRRKLRGSNVKVAHGLENSLEQLERVSREEQARIAAFLESLPSHLVLDGGRLVVAHAGLRAGLQGRMSRRVRDFALYGETSGEMDEFGLPVRYDWAAEYRGKATVVYGHTPVIEAEWVNNTICIDTGCVYGGKLTALRYPERELVSVPSRRVYSPPKRPLAPLSERMRKIPVRQP